MLRYQHAMPMYASDEFITSTCVYDEVHALECGEQGRRVVDIHRSKRRVAQLGPLGACIVKVVLGAIGDGDVAADALVKEAGCSGRAHAAAATQHEDAFGFD